MMLLSDIILRCGVSPNFEHFDSSFPDAGETGNMVTVTENAAKEIKRVMEEQKMSANTVLRIGVSGGGCSGFQYKLGFDDKSDPAKDFIVEQHGVPVAVDKKSDLYLDGTTVDFHNALDKRGFTFNNPNVTKTCGCGSSFGM